MKHYLLIVHEDVYPELLGPFQTEELRDRVARDYRATDDQDLQDGLYKLDCPDCLGDPVVSSYTGNELETEDPED